MDSLPQSKLPVINTGNLKQGTESWTLACHKVRKALEEYGCILVVPDEVSQDFKKEVYANLKNIFDLPTETKMKNSSNKPFHGYVPPFKINPLYESMGIPDPTCLDTLESFANLMWPSGNDNHGFSKSLHSYTNLVIKLEDLVRKMVFESYGVEKYNESFSESMSYLLRPNKYRAPALNETNIGSSMHTDKNFITVLSENQLNGLEIQIKDDEWMAVEYLPSSFLVMAGDAFMAWSNGRIKSARHRVVMNKQEDRYSIVLFAFKKGITKIPQELVDEEHPPKYQPFDNFKFLEFYAKNLSFLDERCIGLYCGN